MPASTKIPTNIFSQLHQCLEGEVILIGDILELDTPRNTFPVETLHKVQVKQSKTITPLIPHLQYKVDFSPHLLELKMS